MPLTNYQSRRRLLLQGLMLGSVALLAVGGLAPPMLAWSADTVQVCHRPPGNPSNIRIITVAQSDVAAHLAHGDTLVTQEACNGVDDDCDGVVDNHLGDLGQCTAGTGDCQVTSVNTCVGGRITCSAAANAACEACLTECVGTEAGCLAFNEAVYLDCTTVYCAAEPPVEPQCGECGPAQAQGQAECAAARAACEGACGQ
jgi:hypothetical protein